MEEAAPRSSISLRDRFSTLSPSAVPTDALPQRFQENNSNPDGKRKAEVIHTSTARSSGSVRFSDRLGLAVASESKNSYGRRIPFYEDRSYDDESSTSLYEGDGATVSDTASESRYGSGNRVIFEEEDHTHEAVADSTVDIYEKMNVPDVLEIPRDDEYNAAAPDVMIDSEEEYLMDAAAEEYAHTEAHTMQPEAYNIPEHTPMEVHDASAEEHRIAETHAPKEKDCHDVFDGGYDFLPRRGAYASTERIVPSVKAPVTPSAEMRAPIRHATVPVLSTEMRGPVKNTASSAVQPVAESERYAMLSEAMIAEHMESAEIGETEEVQQYTSGTSLLEKEMHTSTEISGSDPIYGSEQNDQTVTEISLAGCGETEECFGHEYAAAVDLTDHIAADDANHAFEIDTEHTDLMEMVSSYFAGQDMASEAETVEEAAAQPMDLATAYKEMIHETEIFADEPTEHVTVYEEMMPVAEIVEEAAAQPMDVVTEYEEMIPVAEIFVDEPTEHITAYEEMMPVAEIAEEADAQPMDIVTEYEMSETEVVEEVDEHIRLMEAVSSHFACADMMMPETKADIVEDIGTEQICLVETVSSYFASLDMMMPET
ncbi:MAG: hypothetical protein FWD92_03740, partial [Methanomassiliicoccaceae archaeon]|nr:hypothetical protein [Methanomassiliicoccaceae archaeon]